MTQLDVDLSLRLLLSGLLGAVIGLEREWKGHPAGTRTHMLVALGSALFTIVGAYAFGGAGADPTRIAAQIVTGIGFLGAGAILRAGLAIKGLTTAASLWATAAVGLAVGAGSIALAVVGTGLILFSLEPVEWLLQRLPVRHRRSIWIRLAESPDQQALFARLATLSLHPLRYTRDGEAVEVEVESRREVRIPAIVAALEETGAKVLEVTLEPPVTRER